MDSDSNESDKRFNYDLHLQETGLQEVIDSGEETMDGLDNPMHVTIKREEEYIIMDNKSMEQTDRINDFDDSDIFKLEIDAPKTPDHSYYANETVEENLDIDFSNSLEVHFTRLDPPAGMCTPPYIQENSTIFEEQFTIIPNTDNVKKKTEEEEEESAAKDTSLVDHQYSQPDATNREFCDDLVENMLRETGNEKNPSVVPLLTKFTEIFEHFVVSDKNSETSLYIQSMKRTLKVLNLDQPSTSKDAQMLKDIDKNVEELKEEDVTKKAKNEVVGVLEDNENDPADDEMAKESKEKITVSDEDALIMPENESVVHVKIDLTKVNDFALKLSSRTTELMNMAINSDEGALDVKKQLLMLLKESRKEYRQLILEIKEGNFKADNEINQKSKENLIKKLMEFSDCSNTESESDADQVVNLNRKIIKSGPQTPAIVSSTKKDSDMSENELTMTGTASRRSSLESGTGKENIERQIEKLLDFTTLACSKPASSKKISKQKKIKKLKKKRSSDIESLLDSSDGDSAANPISSSDSERETSDEEQQMLMRQNADIKNNLLAGSSSDSDISNNELSSSSESSDSETLPKKIEKKIKSSVKPADDETPMQASDDTEENNEDAEKEPALTPPVQDSSGMVTSKEVSGTNETVIVESDEEVVNDGKSKPRKYVKRDSFEREIFGKDFLEINGAGNKKVSSPSQGVSSGTTTPKIISKPQNAEEKTSPNSQGTIDVTMFEGRRTNKNVDLQKIFEKREKNFIDLSGPSTSSGVNVDQSKAPSVRVANDDGWITVSSSSESDDSAPNVGSSPRMPKRKKMLTEEELQEETKRANKEETQRVKRLEKKNEALTQMLSQRSEKDEVILDYDSKTKVTISVHPKLVKFLKNHQKEGIKFMYDTCYGSIADEVKTESGCILAHCMGLGKTLQLITLLHTLIMHPKQLKTKKVLVICPKSTIMNWNEEFKKWLDGIDTKNLKVYYLDDQKLVDRVGVR